MLASQRQPLFLILFLGFPCLQERESTNAICALDRPCQEELRWGKHGFALLIYIIIIIIVQRTSEVGLVGGASTCIHKWLPGSLLDTSGH